MIDAYNGSDALLRLRPQDPLLRTYEQHVPRHLRAGRADAGRRLRRHVRYPQDYFAAQAEMFATYHVTDPSLLYNKGNQWQIPTNLSRSPGRAP